MTRIFLGFLLAILPIYTIGFFLYSWGVSVVSTQIEQSISVRLGFFLQAFEAELGRISTQQSSVFSDLSLNELTLAPGLRSTYERIQATLRVQQRLEAIKSSTNYINDVTVFIPQRALTITDNSVEPFSVSDQEFLSTIAERGAKQYFHWGDRICRVETYPFPFLPGADWRSASYVFRVGLSERVIREALKELAPNPGNYCVLQIGDALLSSDPATTSSWQSTMVADYVGSGPAPTEPVFRLPCAGGAIIVDSARSSSFPVAVYYGTPEVTLFQNLTYYRGIFFLFTAITLGILLAFYGYLRIKINEPLRQLVAGFSRVETGQLPVRLPDRPHDEFGMVFASFSNMTERLNALINQVYRQTLLVKRAELRQLQAQVDPHFLYNTFFILSRRIKAGDSEGASQLSNLLGEYFQFITRDASVAVPLSQELAHAMAYAQVQCTRFGDRLRILAMSLPARWAAVPVPRLILQPLLENAFKHGLEDKEEGACLRLEFEDRDQLLIISVEDNGKSLRDETLDLIGRQLADETATGEVTGIINIHRRLVLEQGPPSRIELARGREGGLLVKLTIQRGLTDA